MSLFKHAQLFAEQSKDIASLAELGALLEETTRSLGFDYFALVQHVDVRRSQNRDVVWLGNYPETWREVFEDKGLVATDPIHLASQYTSAGFTWSEIDKLIAVSPHHRRVLEAAAGEGIGEGFTVPAHIPGDSNGTCSFAMRVGRDLPRDNLMAAQLIGTYAMEAGRKIMRRRIKLARTPHLTQRQRECVVYVARGKTDWEIAQILGLKETTVRAYVDSACERYGVNRRLQLVVRALHEGQLSLRDAIG